MLDINQLTYRRLDPVADAEVALAHHRAASIATYGSAAGPLNRARYLKWLRDRVEEFPDGHVLVYRGGRVVGQLDLEAPYGLPTGYIDLYFVREPFRRQGVGRGMHEYVERYFRSWEVKRIELHVSVTNGPAQRFYQHLGYRIAGRDGDMIKMTTALG